MSEQSSSATRLSPLGRFALFVRQVVAELRKVIWPTRRELIAYTIVVVVFVAAMAGIVAVLDYIFTQGVLLIFG
ncbi:MAG: preprotein translocase subunit SecE [Actinomycetes bacterium]|nr:preprotein translocase subunit SecE [Candidatus Nanopelagicales bacterium]MDP4824603.1 preprotein translocase subunit SecE [Candidatus Nanopelagicales bacterium]MDP4888310.1 preprotein translocase subunit SecE [Candidatus Nanopelagicales bacterium]